MTDAQRDELSRLRVKAASPEMVTVPLDALTLVLTCQFNLVTSEEHKAIVALRKAAGIE